MLFCILSLVIFVCCSGSTASAEEERASFFCYCLHVVLWFLFRDGFSSSWYLGWAALFY